MTEIQVNAVRKLRECDTKPLQREAMQIYLAPHVANALVSFCEQSTEFAEAVMAEGKDLVGCIRSMKLPGRGLGYLSDFEVYRMAVQYFFDGADVEWSMKISMPKSQSTAKTGVLDIRLEDFLFGGNV
ncbi:MAG: hypothetical protein IJW51_02465 [Clostridia bacterium]|nr:hypothetical protein [Clostridia bacterium]